MIAKDNRKINVGSKFYFIYLIYVIYISGLEIIDFACYICNIPQTTLISRLIWLIILMVVVYFEKKNISMQSIKLNWKMIMPIVLIILFGMMKSIYPDKCTDTLHYHLMVQHPGFVDYFTEHFAKGNVQAWGFRLGDRLFYGFRYLLGYRMGTILNIIVMCLMYFQINDLLKLLNAKGNKEGQSIIQKVLTCTELWSLLLLCAQQTFFMYGIYLIDILFLPFLFEALRILIKTSRDNDVNQKEIIYFALINGLCFAFKLTNIIFVAPMVIAYIILVYRKINLKVFSLSALVAAMPCLPYLLKNYYDTGNPVFPYLNKLFQSEYYSVVTADYGFNYAGGENIFEKVFWIFYTAFYPEYRQLQIHMLYTKSLQIAVVFLVGISIFLIYCQFRKKEENIIESSPIKFIVLLEWCFAILWGLSTGYPRYFIFGILLLGMIIYYVVCQLSRISNGTKLLCRGICIIVILVVALEGVWTVRDSINGREWSWRKFNFETAKAQVAELFHDREMENTEIDVSMFFVTNTVHCGYADLINRDAYVYNAAYFDKSGVELQEFATLYTENEKLFAGNVYDIMPYNWGGTYESVVSYLDKLNEFDMHITDVENCTTAVSELSLMGLSHNTELDNVCYDSNMGEISFVTENCGNTLRWIGVPTESSQGGINRIEIQIEQPDGITRKVYADVADVLQINEVVIGEITEKSVIRVLSNNRVFVVNPEIIYISENDNVLLDEDD